MIAAVAACLSALVVGPTAGGQGAMQPKPRATRPPLADRRVPAVRVMRGESRASLGPGTIETIAFADSREPPLRVVRGGAGFSGGRPGPASRPSRAATQMVVAFADPREAPVTILRGAPLAAPAVALFSPGTGFDLDRVAFAVDGAESSHGTDPRMWRPDLDGPQGPMQVSAAAAFDIGGGDRFALAENRSLGRAYLARLFGRYGNWADAVAAYNWGPGNLDAWITRGRRSDGLPLEVERYRDRILHEVGLETAPIPSSR
jgi:hypothetical protein